jgi:membrane protein
VGDDDVFTLGAAMAYTWLFAIFPFLVFLLSLVPLIPDRFKPDMRQNVSNFFSEVMPEDVASTIMRPVDDVLSQTSAAGFLGFGIILTMWFASAGMNMTMFAMDKAYDVEVRRPFYTQRPLALLLTLVVATLIILVMILMPIGTGVLKWLISRQSIVPWLYYVVNLARYAIALSLLFMILSIIYHFGPNFKRKFDPITPGAAFTVIVWLLLGAFFRLYLTRFGGSAKYHKTYGAVAGAAILLLFFYIDALVLLIGAEINSEIDSARGRAAPAQASGKSA